MPGATPDACVAVNMVATWSTSNRSPPQARHRVRSRCAGRCCGSNARPSEVPGSYLPNKNSGAALLFCMGSANCFCAAEMPWKLGTSIQSRVAPQRVPPAAQRSATRVFENWLHCSPVEAGGFSIFIPSTGLRCPMLLSVRRGMCRMPRAELVDKLFYAILRFGEQIVDCTLSTHYFTQVLDVL
jgi:hypothetical protein